VGSLRANYRGDASYAASTSPVLLQTVTLVTQNGFAAPVVYAAGAGARSVVVGDFNGDGIADFVTANASNTLPGAGNNVSVFLGNRDGTFQAAVNYLYGNGPYSVAVGDFNETAKPTSRWSTSVASRSPTPTPCSYFWATGMGRSRRR
jgi:hypothetical protein